MTLEDRFANLSIRALFATPVALTAWGFAPAAQTAQFQLLTWVCLITTALCMFCAWGVWRL